MFIENVDDFSQWLVHQLTGLSEADPEALSKYVIALVKKDKSESSLRKICSDQLHVFLFDKTKKFIDDVFDCLKNKSFLRKSDILFNSDSNLTNKLPEKMTNKSQFKASSSEEDLTDFRKYSPSKVKSSDEDRKIITNRTTKRTREHSSHKTHDDTRKKKRYNGDSDSKDKRFHSSRHKSHKSKKHVFDRIDYPHKYLERNDELKLIDYSNEKKMWDIKTSCPDFVEKGVCLKGDSCEFDHGLDIVRSEINCIYSGANMRPNTVDSNWQQIPINQVWVEKFQISKPVHNLVALKNIDSNSYQANIGNESNSKNTSDIYDPSHPEINVTIEVDNKIKVVSDSAPVYVPSQVENNQKESAWWREVDDNHFNFEEVSKVTTVIGSGQSRQRYQQKVSPRRGRYNHNNDNRYNRRQGSARCLLLTHIPLECNNETRLRQHFKTFGKVIEVQVGFQGDQHHALVEFATNEHARAAFRSPLPILDNRFIRTSLFARSNDSNNLTVCKDTSDDESKTKRTAIKYNGMDNEADHVSTGDESQTGQWSRNRHLVNEHKNVDNNDLNRRNDHVDAKWPTASDLKLDRRPNDPELRPLVSKINEESKSRIFEASKDMTKKMQLINDRQEMKTRIDRLEESVQSCKKRLRILLEEQKKSDCDQELIKKQLLESYNYFKELREMLDSLKKKYAFLPDVCEEDKLKIKIRHIQGELVDRNNNGEEYRKQLKSITELKRELVKLQASSKKVIKRPAKLPSVIETKLDNRPKTIYVTGIEAGHSVDDIRTVFKIYQVERVETSDNEVPFFAVKFKTRKEADKVFKEMVLKLKEKNINLSFDKPIPVCDPLDFKTRQANSKGISMMHRGTPTKREDYPSSDEDELKMN